MEVVELLFEPSKIADSIPVAIVESADVHLIDNRIFVPEGIGIYWQTAFSWMVSLPLGGAGRDASLYEATTVESTVRPTTTTDHILNVAQ